jgi:hypothetical protein
MLLRDIAHSRAGDKGDISNLSLILYDSAYFSLVETYVTPAKVKAYFAGLVQGDVQRFVLPQLAAFNFVLHATLGGGVTRSLALDAHGKCLSGLLLNMEIPSAL